MMAETASDMTQAEKDDVCGQAMVLKAFSHFTLAVNYGPVPIKSVASYEMGLDTALEREPVKDVCQYALDLCRDAIPLLKSIDQTGSAGVITKSAAEALSYRIALYMASHPDIQDTDKYNDVIKWADEFIQHGPNRLNTATLTVNNETLPAYARLFVNNMRSDATWNSENPEGIWSILFFARSINSGEYQGGRYKTAQRLGSQMGVPCPDRTANSPIGYADLTYRALNNLYDKYVGTDAKPYPAGDLRRDWNIPTFCYKNVSGEQLADGYSATTRYAYFKVYMPEGITCEREAVFLPVIDRETWTYGSGNLKTIQLEDGGRGYTNAAGQTTFTIEIPRISRPQTMASFNKAVGGIIGYKAGNSLDATTGMQKVNACNQNNAAQPVGRQPGNGFCHGHRAGNRKVAPRIRNRSAADPRTVGDGMPSARTAFCRCVADGGRGPSDGQRGQSGQGPRIPEPGPSPRLRGGREYAEFRGRLCNL